MTTTQKKILKILFDKYERSKTCFGENKVNQKFKCGKDDIVRVYPDYYSNYLDVDVKDAYDYDIHGLESLGYVSLVEEYSDVISIIMNNDMHEEYCNVLKVKSKVESLDLQRQVLNKYKNCGELLCRVCEDQIERLDSNKNNSISADVDILSKTLECINFIVNNKDEILVRELSIELFADSKVFESKYKSRVCRLLSSYVDFSECMAYVLDASDMNDVILSQYNIVANPTYVYFRGNGVLEYSNGYRVSFVSNIPVAISSQTLVNMKSIIVYDDNIMTVENLTSYNRLQSDDTFLLYLGGYNNKAKSDLLKLIYGFNADKKWFHFGDIDPDGFHILKNLINKTEIPFVPYNMGKEQLMKYDKYAKNFEKNDFQKAESLKSSDYADVVNYMFDTKRKLEQEIISWKEPVVKIL